MGANRYFPTSVNGDPLEFLFDHSAQVKASIAEGRTALNPFAPQIVLFCMRRRMGPVLFGVSIPFQYKRVESHGQIPPSPNKIAEDFPLCKGQTVDG